MPRCLSVLSPVHLAWGIALTLLLIKCMLQVHTTSQVMDQHVQDMPALPVSANPQSGKIQQTRCLLLETSQPATGAKHKAVSVTNRRHWW